VLLTDDVFTTGSTLDAAAATLLSSGALAVRVAAVARAW
jgi:predicted amidophosphoribosyltransferase